MIIQDKIFNKRIVLKNLNKKNYNKNYPNWLNDYQINRFLEVRFNKQSKKKIEKYISMSNKNKNCLLLGIFLKKNNVHIGNIKLEPISKIHRRGVIGLFIGEKSNWGKGLATDAIKLISKFANKKFKLKKLVAGCYSNNIGSKKAFLKAGYVIEAILKNYWFDEKTKKFVSEIILSKDY